MKKNYLLALLLSVVCLSNHLFAQQAAVPKPGMWPGDVVFTQNQPVFNTTSISMPAPDGKITMVPAGKIKQSEKDKQGVEHFRFVQQYNGITVENGVLAVHVKAGKVQSQHGSWVKDFPAGLPARAAITAQAAIANAKQHLGDVVFRWDLPEQEAMIKKIRNNPAATYAPVATLVYYSGEKEPVPSTLKLAYKIELCTAKPFGRKIIFVDAVSGNILGVREMMHHTDTQGMAHTAYSGIQQITTDFDGSSYRLRSANRGGGIITWNAGTMAGADFIDNDNVWNNINAAKDEYATDAHWAAEKTYDYFSQKHNRNSYNNDGALIAGLVHAFNGVNAAWDGEVMLFGDGDAGNNFKPLTTMDVVAHEFTHGVTQTTSELVYADESGALNEAFSDIFGTVVEFENKPNADWEMGSEFGSIRSMSNPNSKMHPDTYQGLYWYSGTGDGGGVHTNSAVLNHWFYLLCQGGSGVNDHGTGYTVSGIGMAKAANIAYRLNAFYLTYFSTYNDARTLGIRAAEDFYGVGSNEAVQVANAFTAVGLYAVSCAGPANLAASNISASSATISWTAEPNAAGYTVEYSIGNSGNWTAAGTTNSTSYTLTSLLPGQAYQCRVKSNCSGINGGYAAVSFNTACGIPTGFSSSSITSNSAVLSWSAVAGANSYDLVYFTNTVQPVQVNVPAANGTSYAVSGLISGTVYSWFVSVNCPSNSSPLSPYQQFTTTGTAPCNAPIGLIANTGVNTAILKWTAATGVLNYTVEYKISSSANWMVAGASVTGTTLTLNSLQANTTYDWRIRSNCSSLNSSFVTAQFSTLNQCMPPSNPGVVFNSATNVSFSWDAVSGATTYTLEYKPATASTWTTINNVNGTSYNIQTLVANTTYDWRVRSICGGQPGAFTTSQFTTPLACPLPTGLATTSITGNSAMLGWNAVPGALSYQVDYRHNTYGPWINFTTTTGNSVQLTGLPPYQYHQWRVKVNCSTGLGNYVLAQFTTTAPCEMPYALLATAITSSSAILEWSGGYGADNFTAEYKPASSSIWISMGISPYKTINIGSLQSGTTYDWRVKTNCGSLNSTFVQAQFTTQSLVLCTAPSTLQSAPAVNSAVLNWDAVAGAVDYNVDYKESTAITWTTIVTATNSISVAGLLASTNYDWRVKTNCNGAGSIYTSAVFTTQTPVCYPPDNLNTVQITTNGALLQWSATGANDYTVEYKTVLSAQWISLGNTVNNSMTITGLIPATNYEWRVRANCSTNQSIFVAAHFTTALPACDAPTGLNTTAVTENSALLNWLAAPGAVEYKVEYKTQAMSGWQTIITTSTQLQLTGLDPVSSYDWQVSTNCGANTSPYAAAQFTTLQITCGAPVNFAASVITTTSVLLNWGAGINVAEYVIEYKPASSGSWTIVKIPVTQLTLTALLPGTLYDCRISSDCGNNNTSGYVSLQFGTLPLPCDAPVGLSATNITAGSATLNWPAAANTVSYTVEYKEVSASGWLTATTTGTQFLLSALSPATIYDCRVSSNCGNNSNSSFTALQFTTNNQACNAPTALEGNYNGSSITLSWNAAAGVSQYRLEYKTLQGATWTAVNNISTSSHTVNNLATGSQYQFRVQGICGSNSSAYSNTATVILPCTFNGNTSQGWIDYVKLGSINRSSGAETGGYVNTGMSTNLVIGSSNAMTVSAGFSGGSSAMNYAVFIDFNRNGLFTDAGERVFGVGFINNGNNRNITIAIPSTATPGVTNMRIAMVRNNQQFASCTSGINGEAEDYQVNLVPVSSFAAQAPALTESPVTKVTVMPNPSAGLFSITLPAGFSLLKYELLSIKGKTIISKNETRNSTFTIDISNQPAGIYLLRLVDSNNKTIVTRLSRM